MVSVLSAQEWTVIQMADILDKIPVDDEMTIFKTEVEPYKLNACIDNILMRVDRLETKFADVQLVGRWINVKDKLPDKCDYYLVWFSYICQDVDDEYYREDFGKAFYHDDFGWDVKNIDRVHKPKVLYWQQVTPPAKEANTE